MGSTKETHIVLRVSIRKETGFFEKNVQVRNGADMQERAPGFKYGCTQIKNCGKTPNPSIRRRARPIVDR